MARTAAGLTPRETQVLRLVAEHHSDGEIAGILGISGQTVSNHVSSACRVLGVGTRWEAVERAGLIRTHDHTFACTVCGSRLGAPL